MGAAGQGLGVEMAFLTAGTLEDGGHGTGEAVQTCDAENKHQMWLLHQKEDGLTMIESYFNPGDCLAVVSPQDGGTQLDHGVLAVGYGATTAATAAPPLFVVGDDYDGAEGMCNNGSVGLVPCNDPAAQWFLNGANLISTLCWKNGISSFLTVNEGCSELSVMAADDGDDALLRSQTFLLTEQDFIETIVPDPTDEGDANTPDQTLGQVVPAPASMNIVEIAVGDGSFKTLVAALEAAGLVETLYGDGPFTVFAPTNEAFAKLPGGTLESWLNDIPTLISILKSHVMPGNIPSADVTTGPFKALSGYTLEAVKKDEGVFIDGAKVIAPDIEASNGRIHVINSVIVPKPDEPSAPDGALILPDNDAGPVVPAVCDHPCGNTEVCAKHSSTEAGGKCHTKCPNDSNKCAQGEKCVKEYSHATGITSDCHCEFLDPIGEYVWRCRAY